MTLLTLTLALESIETQIVSYGLKSGLTVGFVAFLAGVLAGMWRVTVKKPERINT